MDIMNLMYIKNLTGKPEEIAGYGISIKSVNVVLFSV